MFKKACGLYFIIISSCVYSMEKIIVTLDLVKNESKTTYWGTYGPGHMVLLYPGQMFHLKQPLFHVVPIVPNQAPYFALTKEIVFEEELPMPHRQLKAVECCLRNSSLGAFLNIKSSLRKTEYSLTKNESYILNVTIDPEENLIYDLIKEKK